MNGNPGLEQAQLFGGQRPFDHLAIGLGYHRFIALIFDMKMRQMVLFRVHK